MELIRARRQSHCPAAPPRPDRLADDAVDAPAAGGPQGRVDLASGSPSGSAERILTPHQKLAQWS